MSHAPPTSAPVSVSSKPESTMVSMMRLCLASIFLSAVCLTPAFGENSLVSGTGMGFVSGPAVLRNMMFNKAELCSAPKVQARLLH